MCIIIGNVTSVVNFSISISSIVLSNKTNSCIHPNVEAFIIFVPMSNKEYNSNSPIIYLLTLLSVRVTTLCGCMKYHIHTGTNIQKG